ncbi:radical SAM protein [uncultured Psychromonas sp.]|uniref:radical SAM protein n=1 Tax=uncultured Psychromonas sp. TaxID=173974 RepID=UPI00261D8360|nr:radical SAM protein [uncultured Psychromonas sp.]
MLKDAFYHSPFMGVYYQLKIKENTAILHIEKCTTDILPGLVKLELALAEQSVTDIELYFRQSAHDSIIKRLSKLNYYAASGHYLKKITYRKSVRFSITEKCNYHCFFCHEEGMEMEVRREKGQHQQFFEVIKQLADLGYDDFTFTGGEPLLNWKGIAACLDYMETINYFPEITIVTNGERINQNMIDRLTKFPSLVRFNLSLHSLLDDEYLEIVHRKKKPQLGNDDLLDKIKSKIQMIEKAGMPFKLNIVLLKDINTSKPSLDAILSYAAESGATSVKFLELLITEGLKDFYPYFYTLGAVKNSLSNELRLLWQNQKKDVYQYQDSNLEVELQHCPCARGCNVCLLNRGVTFTAEMKQFPCFLHPEHYQTLTADNLVENINVGEKYIGKMAAVYQDNSPILIHEPNSQKQETAFYYQLNKDQVERVTRLFSGRLDRIRQFTETYFTHPNSADNEYRKLAKNSYDQTALEVSQKITVLESGAHHTVFLHEGHIISDITEYLTTLRDQGFIEQHTFTWDIQYYSTHNDQYAISQNIETGLYLLKSESPLQELSLNATPLETTIYTLLTSSVNKEIQCGYD